MKLITAFMVLLQLVVTQVAFAVPRETRPGAVIYGAVPPFFGGPPFRALTGHLGRLKDLGIDVLWLSPVNQTDDAGPISYAVTDFFKLRSDFGTDAEFANLVRSAHARGIRVIMDFVPNHTSNKHRFFTEADRGGPNSPYFNFYQRDARGEAVHYFDWSNLMNFNYGNPNVVNHISQAFMYWMDRFGIDGYRVDVAWGVRERAPRFWPALRKQMNLRHPNAIMLAEASAQDPYYVTNGFDLAYDWTTELGIWAWKKAFENPKQVGTLLHQALSSSKSNPQQIGRFLNNNDTGDRFITRYGVATLKVAVVLQFTVPGVPILYTGDEVGAEFSPYEDPEPVVWKDPHRLTPLYKWLGTLREMNPALHSGAFRSLPALNTPEAYAFARFHPPSQSWAVTVLNFGAANEVIFDWPAGLPGNSHETVLCDALNLREVPVAREASGRARVKMAGKSALILSKRDVCSRLLRNTSL